MMRADIASGRDTRETDRLFHIRLAEIDGQFGAGRDRRRSLEPYDDAGLQPARRQ